MAGLGSPTNDTATTPGRSTQVVWDVPETVLITPPWYYVREGKFIAPLTHSPLGQSQRVMKLASDYWSLEPQAYEIANLAERTVAASSVIPASQWQTATQTQTKNLYRPPDAPHITDGASPNLLASPGDPFHIVRRQAGASWNLGAMPAPPALSKVPLTGGETATNLAMDTGAQTNVSDPEDTGYQIRFLVPGHFAWFPDVILQFLFGGPTEAAGFGQFALQFRGTGEVELYEYANGTWSYREQWDYAPKGHVANRGHVMRILPHAGRYLEFQCGSFTTSAFHMPKAHSQTNLKVLDSHLYTDSVQSTGRHKTTLYMTGAGAVRWAARRDLRPAVQISRLLYPTAPTTGLLIDEPVLVVWGLQPGNSQPLTISSIPWLYPGQSITFNVFNAKSGAALTPNGSGGWIIPGQENLVNVQATFSTSDAYHSPLLRQYALAHAAQTQQIAPGTFTGGKLVHTRIQSQERDPSHAEADLAIADLGNELPQLRTRGQIPAKIQVTAGGKLITLFKGYANRINARRRGFDGMRNQSPQWHDYEVKLIGAWERLYEQRLYGQWNFASDPTQPAGPDGRRPPYKVTDVCRTLLLAAGYPLSQIDVPDLAMRLWYSPGDSIDAWLPTPFTRTGEYLSDLVYNYLGGYLLYDENAGSDGMWRLRVGIKAGTPLWHFTTSPPADPLKPPHLLTSYPPQTAPILKDSYQRWVAPPEGNVVIVTNTGELVKDTASPTAIIGGPLINYQSYNPPGFNLANSSNADWLGRFVPIIVWDAQIPAGPQGQFAADWTARRIYQLACRGFQMASFTAPLVFITDPSDASLGGNYRPLRYGDTVTIDGATFLVRSAEIEITHDQFQHMKLECQQARSDDV